MDNNEILLKTLQKENKIISENCKKEEQEKNELIRNYSELEIKYNEEKQKNIRTMNEINEIKNQLNSILYSRSYKLIQKIKKILGR